MAPEILRHGPGLNCAPKFRLLLVLEYLGTRSRSTCTAPECINYLRVPTVPGTGYLGRSADS
eukprot:SAG31_NODE_11575_length_1016_cov_1.649945_1_plen_61_part_01